MSEETTQVEKLKSQIQTPSPEVLQTAAPTAPEAEAPAQAPKRATMEQLTALQVKQRDFMRAKRDAELARVRAQVYERAYMNTVADVMIDCGVDPKEGWRIEDDGQLTRLEPTKQAGG